MRTNLIPAQAGCGVMVGFADGCLAGRRPAWRIYLPLPLNWCWRRQALDETDLHLDWGSPPQRRPEAPFPPTLHGEFRPAAPPPAW